MLSGKPPYALEACVSTDEQSDRAAHDPLLAPYARVHQPGKPDSRLANDPRQARVREQGHSPVAAQCPAQGQQMVIGIDVNQRRLMPGIAQKSGPALRLGTGMIRNRLVILLPRAAGLRSI